MIFINDIGEMLDANVRRAAALAIDKKTIIERLLSGYGVPIDTLLTPDYEGYDATISVGYDPELAKELLAASGYSTDNPVKFKFRPPADSSPKTTRLSKPLSGFGVGLGSKPKSRSTKSPSIMS